MTTSMSTASVVGGMLAAVVASGSAEAVQSKCLAGKNKCMAQKAGALLKCEQKAEAPGKPIEPDLSECRSKAMAKFDGGTRPDKGCFAKLEAKTNNDCVTLGDTGGAEGAVDGCVEQIVQTIDPGEIDKTKCGGAKKACAAKKLNDLLNCHRKAQTPKKPVEPDLS